MSIPREMKRRQSKLIFSPRSKRIVGKNHPHKKSYSDQTVAGALVKKMAKKAKTRCRCSKFSLHKKFKLILEQNVTEQTYPKISCRSQKCLVRL